MSSCTGGFAMGHTMLVRNPLFLRDEELESHLELLLLAERELAALTETARDQSGIDETDFRILYCVQRHPRTTPAELQGVLGLPKQSLSRHVRDLIAGGMLRYETDRSDRRKRPLLVTEAGAALLAGLGEINKRRLRRAFMNAGPEAVHGFERVLSELIHGPARRWLKRQAA
jgi:DNA-binding MarR family transcriptional regulator